MESYCKVLDVGGIGASLIGMRLPTKSQNDSVIECGQLINLGEADKRLASSLILKGSVHGKFQRGITAWLDINMPRYMWSELDTYTVGVAPTSSESTMYTLKKEIKKMIYSTDITQFVNEDALSEHFTDQTPAGIVVGFARMIEILTRNYGSVEGIPYDVLKSALPEGWMQRRIKSFSYQALKGMYRDRYNHRVKKWEVVCDAIETLPYFEELILGCKKEDFLGVK